MSVTLTAPRAENLPAKTPDDLTLDEVQGAAPPPTVDELELQELRAAAEREEAAANAESPAPPAQAEAPTEPVAADAQPAAMIPKARFDEVIAQRNAERDARLRAEGALAAAAALRRQGQQTAPQAAQRPPAPTLDQLIGEQVAKIDAAAVRFDQGEMTLAEFVAVQRDADLVVTGLREQALFEAVMSRMPQPQMGITDQERLAALTEELAQRHPWMGVLKQADIKFLADLVRAEQKALGRPIGEGPADTARLRTEVAKLSDTYGPRWYPETQIPAAAPAQPAPEAVAQGRPPTPPPAQAPRRDALAIAAAHPPNINNLGTAAPGTDEITETQLEGMSSDEIAALPDSVRARFR